MATRHLYNIHTVAASMMYGLQYKNDKLAIQAFKEIFVSGELELLWELLRFAWFLSSPDNPQERNRYDAFCSGDVETFFITLLNSGFELPSISSYENVDPPTKEANPSPWSYAGWTAGQAGALYYAVKNALERGSWRRASRLTIPFLKDRSAILALLQLFGVSKEFTLSNTSLDSRIVEHAFASLCSSAQAPIQKSLDLTTDNTKSQRTWSISAEACALWLIPAPPITELKGSPVFIVKEPTVFWKAAIRDFAVTVDENGLRATEEFYNTYFPSDIPDEWSATEREKSHGFTVPVIIDNPWRTEFRNCFSHI